MTCLNLISSFFVGPQIGNFTSLDGIFGSEILRYYNFAFAWLFQKSFKL